ncbi:MAG: UDP-N-acetylmuramate dehydrogenase [Microscillaceae bacterium]|jgi:UDP-N-acetylmuramate dehydrogenase|nr:UDP-N-acetylmuramate dehydrogenase [Microscillaceae bacterium]
MHVQENFSLQNYNTFGIEAQAKRFAEFRDIAELRQLLQAYPHEPKLILGGGSNLLFTQDFAGLVLKNSILGISQVADNQDFVVLKVGAGENWHQFVLHCLANHWAGVENLSLIPGLVGASPMQNIGAYGVEVKEVIESVEALAIADGSLRVFSNAECKFGYRESIFKNELKNQYIITHVHFRLAKQPNFKVSYGDIQKTLQDLHIQELTIQAVSQAVCQIRQSKLPNPAELGNAGSFFKNPEIPTAQFEKLKTQFPTIPSYPINAQIIKIPAGWLIEQAGWKGKRSGNIGVHDKQALVIVNYGGGKGLEIKQLAQQIQTSVREKFGIELKPEVNFI